MPMALKLFLLAALSLGAVASELTLKLPQLSISSPNAPLKHKETLDVGRPSAIPIELEPSDTLKLSFQIVERDSDKGVQPHQAFLRLFDQVTNEEGIIPLRVSSGGKVNFDLDLSKPPPSLPPTGSNALKAFLILGSFLHSPAKLHLFDLRLPASQPPPQHADDSLYQPLPTIAHTFRPEQKLPLPFVSAFFTLLVLSSWIALFALLVQIPHRVPNLFTGSVLPFVLFLAGLEGLLFKYWISLKLGEVLAYGFIVGLITLGAGKRALTALSKKRLAKTS